VSRIAPFLGFGVALIACGSRTGLLAPEATDAGPTLDAPAPAPDARAACSAGPATTVTTLASGQRGAQSLALDDAYVYWESQGQAPMSNGSIVRVAKCGGTPFTLASDQAPSWSIAVDATDVYWGVVPTGDIGNGVLVHEAKAGGEIVTLVVNVYDPLYVAVDDQWLFWTSPVADTVAKVPKTGGPVTTLASMQANPHEIALAEGQVVWLNVGVEGGPGAVMFMSKTGGMPATLASASFPSGLATAGATAYAWQGGGVQALFAYPFGDGVPTQLAPVPPYVSSLATDGTNVYLADIATGSEGAGFIGSVSRFGGAVTTLQSGVSGPSAVAVDDDAVYWIDDMGNVLRGPK
jgi:hypothetical protein